ncbi:MAG TPA: 3-deoxy-manno-octulosonate cytidylyltransferase [Bacteroidales bacterium]|jgi:3-deoxy-manno-octulosonate cytidylyltransferase (CMP-KDO synthetase)|nr:3-deoxy-manno-octulosonate cytidylyltransferase [Bacteroidales bacterium]HPE40641.1 3-deoxy-manno-octulosonate cytidylyltransferase [Bacteroidales bacterium]
MKKIGIIPARYGSSRFPGKPLVDISGKPMIQHVFERAMESSLDEIYVATDDQRIVDRVIAFDGNVLLTSPNHPSGTDRCGEASIKLHLDDHDIIVNIQGDEPFIQKEQIDALVALFDQPDVEIATLVKPFDNPLDAQNPNKVKVVFSNQHKALYFSRSPIPYPRDSEEITYYKHLGIYAYRYQTLKKLITLPISSLEKVEKLEQLRWLENNFSIFVAITDHESIAIDTPEDMHKIHNLEI